jgi:hypothetical protein
MLAPGGVFRLVVPDLLARAKHYVNSAERSADASEEFLRATGLGKERTPHTLVQFLREIFGGSAHLWMWDEMSISSELQRAGFVRIRPCEFGDATDEMFSRVEDHARFVDSGLGIRECSVEARKP